MKKVTKALSLLLAIVMIASIFPLSAINSFAATNGHSQAQAIAYLDSLIGQKIGTGECPALAKQYYSYLGYSVSGNGKDYEYNVPSGWTRIYYSSGFVPQPGDVAVWRKTNTEGGSKYGHVAIVKSANSSKMICYEQGASAGYKVRAHEYQYGSVTCFIRPDYITSPQIPTKPETSVNIKPESNGASTNVDISWTPSPVYNSDLDARIYELRVYSGTDTSGTLVYSNLNLTGTSISLMLSKNTFTVTVTAVNTKNRSYSTVSNPVTFSIAPTKPIITVNVKPENSGASTNVDISWTASPVYNSNLDSRQYEIRVYSGSNTGGALVYSNLNLNATSISLLLSASTFTVTVTAVNTKYSNCSTVSEPVTFSINSSTCIHSWGTPTYKWSSDNKTCTATRTCTRDSSHIETQTVNTTSQVIKQPTTTATGTRKFTATFTNSAFTTQTKNVSIPKLAEPVDDDIYFPDVSESSWYYDAVQYVAKAGFMSGYQNGYFGPGDSLKRQDFVVILANIAKVNLSSYASKTPKLKDVKKGAYYAAAVNWAVDNGIIAGYANGNFGVNDNITREQVATILYRYMGEPSVSGANSILAKFSDSGKISSFAKTPVAWAVKNEIISGMADGRVAPTEGASRAQIASIIMRMDQKGMF